MVQIQILSRDGRQPFMEWLHGLRDLQARARIRTRLDRLALGNMGDCRALDDGVYELKIDWEPGYRVYFGKVGNAIVLLLCGGDKRTQQQDISTAKAFLAEYHNAKKNH